MATFEMICSKIHTDRWLQLRQRQSEKAVGLSIFELSKRTTRKIQNGVMILV